MNYLFLSSSFLNISLDLLVGFMQTLKIFFVTLLISLPFGLVIAFGSMSKIKPLKWLCTTFVWIIRGTPLMLQLIVIYYGPGLIFGVGAGLNEYWSTFITFGINYACYFSEIYRGGIESVSKSQTEAGLVLGMTKSQIFFKVILLQVIKRIVPPMSNEIITLVKDTSLANTIGVLELIFNAKELMLSGLIWPLFYAGAFYLIFVGILTILFGKLEKKLSYFKV